MKNYRRNVNGVPMAFMCDDSVRPVNGVLRRVDDDYYPNEYQNTSESNNGVDFSVSFNHVQGDSSVSIHAGALHIDISVSRS